jgi:hypothetical protein
MRVIPVAIVALSLSITSIQVARADASGCSKACVHVHGSKNWVSQVRSGVELGVQETVTGFSDIKSTDGYLAITTPTGTYTNSHWPSKIGPNPPPVEYPTSGWYNVNHTFASGTQVCSTFWKKERDGHFSRYGTACVTIHG